MQCVVLCESGVFDQNVTFVLPLHGNTTAKHVYRNTHPTCTVYHYPKLLKMSYNPHVRLAFFVQFLYLCVVRLRYSMKNEKFTSIIGYF